MVVNFQSICPDVLHLHYALDPKTFEIGFKVNPSVAKSVIPASKMRNFTAGILKGLQYGLDQLVGDHEIYTVSNPNFFLQRFVAYMSVPTLVGQEVATHPDVLASFADFTGDITSNIGIFMATPKWLHPWLLPHLSSFHKHQKVMIDHVKPVVQARRKQMELLGENHNLPPNFLQGLIEFKKADGTYYTDDEVALSVLLVAFASVHTTSMNLSFSIYWLIARPDVRGRIEQEIKDVLGDAPVDDDKLTQMTYLDNFIREVLRQGVDKLANTKAVLSDVYTFANGYQVPKGKYRDAIQIKRLLTIILSRPSCAVHQPPAEPRPQLGS